MSSFPLDSIINNKYQVLSRLGGGSFGEIFLCQNSQGEQFAVKTEPINSRCPQLRHEYKVYRELQGNHGFPKVYYFGQHDKFNVMVIERLGRSLEDVFVQCQNKFSTRTVLKIADQMISRIEKMHNKHLIHRDIKPANFVFGYGEKKSNILFSIDFGLSKRYRNPDNLVHIPKKEGKSLTGTPRYASINNHLGVEQSRRDDLESIAYVLIYFLRGNLPWQGLKAQNAEKKYQLIGDKKQAYSVSKLCRGLPSVFAWFLQYCRDLEFDEDPDIPLIKQNFRDLFLNLGYSDDHPFDWEITVSPSSELSPHYQGLEGNKSPDSSKKKSNIKTYFFFKKARKQKETSKQETTSKKKRAFSLFTLKKMKLRFQNKSSNELEEVAEPPTKKNEIQNDASSRNINEEQKTRSDFGFRGTLFTPSSFLSSHFFSESQSRDLNATTPSQSRRLRASTDNSFLNSSNYRNSISPANGTRSKSNLFTTDIPYETDQNSKSEEEMDKFQEKEVK